MAPEMTAELSSENYRLNVDPALAAIEGYRPSETSNEIEARRGGAAVGKVAAGLVVACSGFRAGTDGRTADVCVGLSAACTTLDAASRTRTCLEMAGRLTP